MKVKFTAHPDFDGERILEVADHDADRLMISLDKEKTAFFYVNDTGPVMLKRKQLRQLAKNILKETAK